VEAKEYPDNSLKKNQKAPELSPEKFTGLKLEKAKSSAAGLAGVWAAVNHVLGAMNPLRASKVLFELNQKGGIDCPGCAWPDPEDRSKLGEYCENGAKAIAEEATTKKLETSFFQKYSIQELSEQSDFWIGKRGRITQAMHLAKGQNHYSEISWEKAYSLIADRLNELESPNDAVFYTSGRTSNEAAFLYQLMVRMYGSNNLPDCSNMCHESSGVALSETLGIGKGSVKLEDFSKAEVILVIGQNPGTNHPRMLSALKKAKENNAKIISINPLPETGLINFKDPQSIRAMAGSGSKLSDLFLQVRINGDVALFKALAKLLLQFEEERGSILDHDFIQNKTSGYEALVESLQSFQLDELCENAGVNIIELRKAAEIIAGKNRIIACWAMGLTQHKNGVDNIKEVLNLLLLKGSIGKEGAGTCPVRGHSNVQGDRTMGIWEKPKDEFLDSLEKEFQFSAPRKHGLDVVEAIKKMHSQKGMVFFAMGGNFLSASPDTSYTADALRNCKLTVHVSTKLNRSHLVPGEEALILPSLGRSDQDFQDGIAQFVSVENSMGIVHSSSGKLKPLSSKLKSEPAIVCELAQAIFQDKYDVNWKAMAKDYDLIREKIEACIPGFEDYNNRIRKASGFYLPNGPREGQFNTPNKLAHFSITEIPEFNLGANQYLMATVRTHDQFNTTIYGLNDRYRGIMNERRVILMNPEDMEKAELKSGDVVDIYSHFKGEKRYAPRFLVIPYDVSRNCTITYFPETNVLVPIDSAADKSNTPTSKMVKISLEKVEV
tara:strand:- start:44748 stop:47075 length:2328 start_codon:yes stop_codon:yes gene_type:complete